MEKRELPHEKGKKMIARADALTNPEYGSPPQERTIEQLIQNGIVNLDKPPGPTSHEVVAWLKRIVGISKAGHSGTLDPQVTGVLPVALMNATKVIPVLLGSAKEYISIMRLHKKQPDKKITQVVEEFQGKIYQRPPLRSSVKRRLRTRTIYYIDTLEIEDRNVLLRIGCQAGTYIRKLIHDIGEVLGCGAHMQELRRTRSGPFKEDKSLATLYDLIDAYEFWREDKIERPLRDIIQPVENAVPHVPKIVVRDTAVDAICHGAHLAAPGIVRIETDIKPGIFVSIFTLKDELVALARAQRTTKQILETDHGLVAKTERVIMPLGTYPSFWKLKDSQAKNK